MRVTTDEYRKSHWKEPRGRGTWLFDLLVTGEPGHVRFVGPYNATYGEAKRAAIAKAKEIDALLVVVLP